MNLDALRAHALERAEFCHDMWIKELRTNPILACAWEETMYEWLFVWVRGERA